MAEMLLLNPRRRRKSARRAPAHRAAPKRHSRRRRNPITASAYSPVRRVRRRSAVARHTRRRRNPIGGGASSGSVSMVNMLKQALVGGAGGVVMDFVMGTVNPMLPAALQTTESTVGVGDAVKAGITIALGRVLHKPTKGLSTRMAIGALTCQARDIIAVNLPQAAPLGYASPARVIPGLQRVGPMNGLGKTRPQGAKLGAYMAQGATPMLNGVGAYQSPGTTAPLLSNVSRVMQREGYPYR